MVRQSLVMLFAVLLSSTAWSQAPRWNWKAGQVHTYRVDQQTTITDRVEDTQVETKTSLQLVKHWQVASVDAKGIATLELTLGTLKLESIPPDGNAISFDSANPEKGTPGLRESVGQYVGKKLAALRIDPRGNVIDVQESNFGPKSRFENELPFVGVLPSTAPQVGSTWTREFNLTLPPPQGVGDTAATVQKYTCKSLNNASLVVELTTALVKPPEAAGDRIPWLQYLPKGTLTFDVQAGRLQKAELKISEKVTGHQGEESSYSIESTYTEVLVEK